MKKVLIVTYYWPPAGGGGVMRWLKMTRYIHQSGIWQPIIFSPENAGYLVQDHSLMNEVPKEIKHVQTKIIEPNNFLELLGLKSLKKSIASGGMGSGKKNKSLKDKLVFWVRSNLFVPDARFLWIKPASKKLIEVIKEENIDTVITTGPPHSLHLMGLNAKKKTKVKWIADFRDPWTFIDFFEDLDLSSWAKKKHFRQEKSVVDSADGLVTVSKSWAKRFEELYGRKFKVITNGYDPADFKDELDKDSQNAEKFTITHIGSLNKDRNPPLLWKALGELCEKDNEFREQLRVELIGNITPEIEYEIEKNNLKEQVILKKYLDHKSVIEKIRRSTLLLLLINNTSNQQGIIPGKLYEYIAAKRPILCIGNETGDTAAIIKETEAGKVVNFTNITEIKKILEYYFQLYKKGEIDGLKANNIEKYSRKSLAYEYMEFLNRN